MLSATLGPVLNSAYWLDLDTQHNMYEYMECHIFQHYTQCHHEESHGNSIRDWVLGGT